MAIASPPSEGEETVGDLLESTLGSIPKRGEVGDQPRVPEQQRNGEVGTHRKHVPEQWTAELRPHLHLIRKREEPVDHPNATDMDAGENAGTHHREDRHRFREPVDARPPFLSEEEEDCGDQRPGVTNADPEHEVRDVVRPSNRRVQTPDTDPGEDEVEHTDPKDAEEPEAPCERHVPRKWGATSFADLGHLRGHLTEGGHIQHQRGPGSRDLSGVINDASADLVGSDRAHDRTSSALVDAAAWVPAAASE